MKKLINSSIFLLLFSIAGCDIYTDDREAQLNTTIIKAIPGNSTFILPKSYMGQAALYEVKGSVQHGTVDFFAGSNAQYLKYTSFENYANDEKINLVAKDDNGNIISEHTFQITKAEGCGRGAPVDSIKVKINETAVIDLLNNDIFCGMTPSRVAVCSCGTFGNAGFGLYTLFGDNDLPAKFTFTAGPEPGKQTFIYTLGVNYTTITDDWIIRPELFEKFYSGTIVVEVIE